MPKDITIQILKERDQSAYPQHITVKRTSTGELAHLYFDKGNLKRMTYLVHNKKTGKDELKMDYTIQNGQFQLTTPDEVSSEKVFFIRTMSAVANRKNILFFDDNALVAASIKMDLNGQCLPDYLDNHRADITYISDSQKPLSKSITIQNIQKEKD